MINSEDLIAAVKEIQSQAAGPYIDRTPISQEWQYFFEEVRRGAIMLKVGQLTAVIEAQDAVQRSIENLGTRDR
jgi:hypothetical protein